MSDAMTTAFFDPITVRHRLATHQYKESDDVRTLRRLDNLYLIDFKECRLKGVHDYENAQEMLLTTRLRDYASNFALFVLGDWPTQFYLRQIVYAGLNRQATLEAASYT